MNDEPYIRTMRLRETSKKPIRSTRTIRQKSDNVELLTAAALKASAEAVEASNAYAVARAILQMKNIDFCMDQEESEMERYIRNRSQPMQEDCSGSSTSFEEERDDDVTTSVRSIDSGIDEKENTIVKKKEESSDSSNSTFQLPDESHNTTERELLMTRESNNDTTPSDKLCSEQEEVGSIIAKNDNNNDEVDLLEAFEQVEYVAKEKEIVWIDNVTDKNGTQVLGVHNDKDIINQDDDVSSHITNEDNLKVPKEESIIEDKEENVMMEQPKETNNDDGIEIQELEEVEACVVVEELALPYDEQICIHTMEDTITTIDEIQQPLEVLKETRANEFDVVERTTTEPEEENNVQVEEEIVVTAKEEIWSDDPEEENLQVVDIDSIISSIVVPAQEKIWTDGIEKEKSQVVDTDSIISSSVVPAQEEIWTDSLEKEKSQVVDTDSIIPSIVLPAPEKIWTDGLEEENLQVVDTDSIISSSVVPAQEEIWTDSLEKEKSQVVDTNSIISSLVVPAQEEIWTDGLEEENLQVVDTDRIISSSVVLEQEGIWSDDLEEENLQVVDTNSIISSDDNIIVKRGVSHIKKENTTLISSAALLEEEIVTTIIGKDDHGNDTSEKVTSLDETRIENMVLVKEENVDISVVVNQDTDKEIVSVSEEVEKEEEESSSIVARSESTTKDENNISFDREEELVTTEEQILAVSESTIEEEAFDNIVVAYPKEDIVTMDQVDKEEKVLEEEIEAEVTEIITEILLDDSSEIAMQDKDGIINDNAEVSSINTQQQEITVQCDEEEAQQHQLQEENEMNEKENTLQQKKDDVRKFIQEMRYGASSMDELVEEDVLQVKRVVVDSDDVKNIIDDKENNKVKENDDNEKDVICDLTKYLNDGASSMRDELVLVKEEDEVLVHPLVQSNIHNEFDDNVSMMEIKDVASCDQMDKGVGALKEAQTEEEKEDKYNANDEYQEDAISEAKNNDNFLRPIPSNKQTLSATFCNDTTTGDDNEIRDFIRNLVNTFSADSADASITSLENIPLDDHYVNIQIHLNEEERKLLNISSVGDDDTIPYYQLISNIVTNTDEEQYFKDTSTVEENSNTTSTTTNYEKDMCMSRMYRIKTLVEKYEFQHVKINNNPYCCFSCSGCLIS